MPRRSILRHLIVAHGLHAHRHRALPNLEGYREFRFRRLVFENEQRARRGDFLPEAVDDVVRVFHPANGIGDRLSLVRAALWPFTRKQLGKFV